MVLLRDCRANTTCRLGLEGTRSRRGSQIRGLGHDVSQMEHSRGAASSWKRRKVQPVFDAVVPSGMVSCSKSRNVRTLAPISLLEL